MSRVDLWEEILSLFAVCGHEIHWLQVPSHIGIRGNHKAGELADVGPLLFGHMSVNMLGRVEDGMEEEEEFDKQSLLGMGEEEPAEEDDLCVHSTPLHCASDELCRPIKTSPQMQRQLERGNTPLEVEACTPLHFCKRSKPCSPPPPHGSSVPHGNQYIASTGR